MGHDLDPAFARRRGRSMEQLALLGKAHVFRHGTGIGFIPEIGPVFRVDRAAQLVGPVARGIGIAPWSSSSHQKDRSWNGMPRTGPRRRPSRQSYLGTVVAVSKRSRQKRVLDDPVLRTMARKGKALSRSALGVRPACARPELGASASIRHAACGEPRELEHTLVRRCECSSGTGWLRWVHLGRFP